MSHAKKKSILVKRINSVSIFSWIFLIIFCASIVLPFVHELAKSLSHPFEVDAMRVLFVPKKITLGNYHYYIRKQLKPLTRALGNTFFLVFVGGVLSVTLMISFAYPLSRPRREFRVGSLIIYALVFCIIFQRPLIPLRIAFQMYGLLNTRMAIVINMLIQPFLVILAITYFKSLPEDIFDAARIDGANDFTTFFRIIAPLCKSLIVTIFLIQAVAYWNSYLQAKLLLIDSDLYPIQNFIQNIMRLGGDISDVDYIRDPFANSESIKSALLIISAIPLTVVYISLQKYFTRGVMVGAVKG